jgi:heterodisulfide reductase subunit B
MAEKKEYVYYEGCSLEGTAAAYDASIRLVMKSLGVTLVEPADWSCCGSTPAHAVDHLLAAALAGRNLAIVERMGAAAVATPCPSCLSALKKAHDRMARNTAFRDEVNSLLDAPYNCTVTAKSVLQILTRPPKLACFDDPENPVSMDRIIAAAGVEVVDFAFKLECCGAAFGVPKKEMVLRLTAKVLSMAQDAGANCIAVACPLCQQNLDLRQGQVNAALGTSFDIPVLYFSQVLGLAYGYTPAALGINKHIVSPDALIRSRTQIEAVALESTEVKETASKLGGASPLKRREDTVPGLTEGVLPK